MVAGKVRKKLRYVLDISYKGTHYAGWQIQPNAITVQEVLQEALTTFLRKPTTCTGAGRTDAGVHARQLIVHFDHEGPLNPRFLHAVNGILPADIAVNAVCKSADPDFHARFHALNRAYVYQIVRRKSPLHEDFAYWVRYKLDVEAMNKAGELLKEYEEFGSFCKAYAANETNLCDIHHAYWEETDELLLFHIKANRFLRGMVRAVVGTLLEIGRGKIGMEGFRKVIEAQDRSAAGPAVAAKGLFLTEVNYPENSFLAV